MAVELFFLPASVGKRLAVAYWPHDAATARGAVVYVHPFAEEMNKSRRMAALQARAMAAAGYAVLQVDSLGCGDSSGDFGEASWEAWRDDVNLACEWIQNRTPAPLWLWGLRSGCLLANEAAIQMAREVNLLFWQPVVAGSQHLQQFLRLRIAGELLGKENRHSVQELRQQLRQGQAIEVGGYLLSPAVARGLEKAELLLPHRSGRVEWIEIASREDGSLSPAAAARLTQWQAAGQAVRARTVCGPPFWQTAEISECPALVSASLLALDETGW